jgi:NADH-ubiquinone oxidoreductase chain 2
MYLSIELQSFGVYILASIYRDSESSTNAGLKYFLLGGLSSCLILLGCVLIYSYTGVINFEDIYSLLVSASGPNNDISTILQLGLILIFIGFLFKIAAAPFHN